MEAINITETAERHEPTLVNNNHGGSNGTISKQAGKQEAKRQQFTNKQRMDMYAFCVLELEMHSNKVSIKKQQQAIQRVLNESQKESHKSNQPNQVAGCDQNQQQATHLAYIPIEQQQQQQQADPSSSALILEQPDNQVQATNHVELVSIDCEQTQTELRAATMMQSNQDSSGNRSMIEEKTLLQLQQEVAMTRKCYSDYQKTQVLTSSMLRDVQKRFSKYYPDAAIPSRSTIKHVFEKCVTHGTVDNIRTPRKAIKIPQGDEIEHLLIHEPQLSLRQLAHKLNVSTGTISRRCKALGLVPESVTIKHQQLATARRQKQIKQLENQSRSSILTTPNMSQLTTNGNHFSPEQPKLEPASLVDQS